MDFQPPPPLGRKWALVQIIHVFLDMVGQVHGMLPDQPFSEFCVPLFNCFDDFQVVDDRPFSSVAFRNGPRPGSIAYE